MPYLYTYYHLFAKFEWKWLISIWDIKLLSDLPQARKTSILKLQPTKMPKKSFFSRFLEMKFSKFVVYMERFPEKSKFSKTKTQNFIENIFFEFFRKIVRKFKNLDILVCKMSLGEPNFLKFGIHHLYSYYYLFAKFERKR